MNLIEKILSENSHVHIHDDKRSFVEETINALIREGRKMLHVVADYDFTLTMCEKDGVKLPSTFAVIETKDHLKVRIELYGNFLFNTVSFLVLSPIEKVSSMNRFLSTNTGESI